MDEDLTAVPEEISKQEEIEARATVAGPDTEDQLRVLKNLQDAIRVPSAAKTRYENLRNKLARQLSDEGARWFLDDNGDKWLGYVMAPETTVLDIELALEMVEEGEIEPEVLEQIAPRKQSVDGIKQAIIDENLTPHQITRLLSFEKRTRFVKYARPLEERDAGQE